MEKLKLLTRKEKPIEKVEPQLEPISKPISISKPKKFERKLARKISSDSDTSEELIPSNPPESESVFLKSLSALRDNVLTPAEDDAVHQAGRLLGAMGIIQDSDSDLGFYRLLKIIIEFISFSQNKKNFDNVVKKCKSKNGNKKNF